MVIAFDCVCGKRLQAGDNFAGRPFVCPFCRSTRTVPTPAAPVVDLGIVVSAPVRLSTRRRTRPSRKDAPLNSPGLVAMLIGCASWLPIAIAWLFLMAAVYSGRLETSVAVCLMFCLPAMASAGFGLLIAHLAEQQVAKPFCLLPLYAGSPIVALAVIEIIAAIISSSP